MFPQINVVDFGSVHINDRATRKVTGVGMGWFRSDLGWDLGLLCCVIEPDDRRLKLKLMLKFMIFSCGWYFWVGWGFARQISIINPGKFSVDYLWHWRAPPGPALNLSGAKKV